MRKILYLILIVLTCISCKNRNQLEYEFENHLPEVDQKLLENIVSSYDNLIKTLYNGSVDEFISQIESNQPSLKEYQKQEYCKLVRMFHESTLEFKSINVKYDSVYLSDSGSIIKIAQPEDISEDELQLDEEIFILPSGGILEEEIEEIKRKGYWRFISASSFTSALSVISDSNFAIQEYIDAKHALGYINPQRMASSILTNEVDKDNYFIKRIMAIELFIKQIKNEFGC